MAVPKIAICCYIHWVTHFNTLLANDLPSCSFVQYLDFFPHYSI